MILLNDAVLKSMRGRNRCEGCGVACQTAAHHCFVRRGLGGGTRLDVSWQLIRVGYWCCHRKAEDDPAYNEHLKAIVAAREGCTVTDIEEACRFILRCPRGASPEWLLNASVGLPAEVKRLVRCGLEESGKL